MSFSQSLLSSSEPVADWEWVMDVPCAIDVVLGTSTLTVEECGSLALNAVLRLKQPAGTDLEVRVSGLPFAAGELVVADDAVSLRVGRILPPAPERLS